MGAEKKRDRRPYAALVLVLLFGIGWCSSEEDPAESAGPSVVFVPTPEPEPIARAPEPIDAATDFDAGTEQLDAGAVVLARKQPDYDAYMRRWKDALEPLFKNGKYPGAPTVIRAERRPQPEEQDGPDAGPCEPISKRLSLALPRFDIVVVVDTSGSMAFALPVIAAWLGELERSIVKSRSDTQLLVVAEQQELGRTKGDGGYDLAVGSSDAVEVLLEGAVRGRDRWVDALRTRAELQIVLVTDDESRGQSVHLLRRLNETLLGVPFSVSLLGGLDTPRHKVLDPEEPIVSGYSARCDGEGLEGLEPGVVYQELVRATGGFRAPLCWKSSRWSLSWELLNKRSTLAAPQCGWVLNAPRHRVDRVSAVGLGRASAPLLYEPVRSNCFGTRRSYRMADEQLLVLCDDTCTELRHEGFEALELKLECKE